jgi:apolipoprotein N-acyltransferase
MVVAVPGERVPTLYARTGEIVPLVALGFCVLALVRVVRGRRRAGPHARAGGVAGEA